MLNNAANACVFPSTNYVFVVLFCQIRMRSMSVINRNAEYFFDVGVHLFLSDYSCIHTCMKWTKIVKPV